MSAVGKLFGGGESIIQPPPIITPPPMPTPDDDVVKKAKRRALEAQYARRGRASTIMSDAVSGSEALGG